MRWHNRLLKQCARHSLASAGLIHWRGSCVPIACYLGVRCCAVCGVCCTQRMQSLLELVGPGHSSDALWSGNNKNAHMVTPTPLCPTTKHTTHTRSLVHTRSPCRSHTAWCMLRAAHCLLGCCVLHGLASQYIAHRIQQRCVPCRRLQWWSSWRGARRCTRTSRTACWTRRCSCARG